MRLPAHLRPFLGRDVAVASGVVAGLYALAVVVPFQPLVVPGYLLLVGYDAIEGALPVLSGFYAVGFPLYCYLLAVLAAAVARRLRAAGAPNAWRPGAAAALLVVGGLALTLAVGVYAPLGGAGGAGGSATESPWTPFLIVAGAGAALSGLGAYLAGYRVRLARVRGRDN